MLDVLAKRVLHVGAGGAGATVKLAVNAIVHATNQALAEALVLAERAGVDRAHGVRGVRQRRGGVPLRPLQADAFERPGETAVAFSLDLVAKDYALILALAERVGARMEQAATGQATAAAAVAAGLGQKDMAGLAELLRAASAGSAG